MCLSTGLDAIFSDTDLLLFSLRLPSNFSVDFLRLNDRKRTLISVDAVKEKVLHGLKGDREKNIQDWIFLTLISGTDYTPRLGGFDYPKVYHHWRSVKMNPSNENFHIFEKISSQRGDNGISPAPKDSSSSLTSQHTIETSPWTSEYVLNLENLDKILQAANFPSIDREHLQIQTKNKLRDIRISQSDWKGNWNLMRQAFCSTLKIESITEPSGASSGEYVTKVYWTDPSTNKRHLAGEGHGVNAKTSEFFSSISCCLPTSSIMTQHISKQMSSNDYDRLSAAIVNLSFTQGSEKTTQQKISENENKNSTPYVFSADEKSRDRIAPFTKDSKVLEEHKEACEEFVKGVFWTFSTISAEIPNGRYFYPYTHTPTVFALQSYIAKAHQHSPTISISIGSHGIEKNEDEIEKKNVLVIPSTNYCEDAIPPVQFFATVTTSVSSANSALGEATQAIFKKTGELQAPVRPYYTLEKVEASSVKVSSRSGGYTPTYECIEMRDESKKFLENIRRACPPQAIVSMIAQLRSIRDGPSDESPFDSSTSLEELEPGLFRCEPSLVFFNYQLPDSATLEERNNLKTFIERNKETLDRWDQAVIDPKKLVERTHPLIKAWTGDDFAQIACFEEQKVHSIFGGSVDEDGKEKGAKEIGRKNEMRLTGQRPHFRPFNTPKTSFDKRWYHSHSRIGVTYTKQTKRKVASKSSAPPSHSTSSFRPNLSSLRTLLRR